MMQETLLEFINREMEAHFTEEDLKKHLDGWTDMSYDILQLKEQWEENGRLQH